MADAVLQVTYRASERQAVRLVGQHRSTRRNASKIIYRGGQARASSQGDRSGRHPLGQPHGLPPAATRRLGREPQTALAGGGTTAAHPQKGEVSTVGRRLRATSPGRASPPGECYPAPVRWHRRWPQARVPERDR